MYLFWHVVYRPYLASPTSSRIYLTPYGQQGITCHIVPFLHVVTWPCLTSPTHSRIYLFPHGQQGMTRHTVMWSFGPIGNNLIHTFKDLPMSCKMGASNLTRHHKDEVITNIIAQGQTHIKSSQVKCIQNISFTSK